MTEKLALLVRTHLDMGRGKIAVQVAHAAVMAVLATQGSSQGAAWLDGGQPKVVLRVGSDAELSRLAAAARAAGLPVELVRDAGRTQLLPAVSQLARVIGNAQADGDQSPSGAMPDRYPRAPADGRHPA